MKKTKKLQAERVIKWFLKHIDNVDFINKSNSKKICDLFNEYSVAVNIEENLKISLKLWKLLITDAFIKIGIEDINSSNALAEYMDSFSEFEGILFGIDKKYRDHIIHTVWVFLIGYYLVKKQGKFDMIRTNIPLDKIEAAWCIIALCHDLGYPFSKIEKIYQSLNEMIEKIKGISLEKLTVDKTDEYEKYKNDLLLLLSSEYIVKNKGDYYSNKEHQLYFLDKRPILKTKYEKSMITYEHGIMSCLVLVHFFPFFSKISPKIIGENISFNLKEKFDTGSSILQAIANHTCKDIKIIGKNRFSIFLMICDEIAELYRPTRWNNKREMRTNICEIIVEEFDIDKKEVTLQFKTFMNDNEISSYCRDVKKKFKGATKTHTTTPTKTYSKTCYRMNFINHNKEMIGNFSYDSKGNFSES